MQDIKTAFVTGSTGLLGNNLVKDLLSKGIGVTALARNAQKAEKQLGEHSLLTVVTGDMEDVSSFADTLHGCDIVFHTAAYFRDSYKGGRHWDKLYKINVQGTSDLLNAAYEAGIRRLVHTSSIAVLQGKSGGAVDETSLRKPEDAEDYYRSKILADREVFKHLEKHPDFHASFVLPGWMHGPGDVGPTSAGQFTLDYMERKLPGIPPATVSFVDARDVAKAMILAAEKGRRGERYLAAGRHMSMKTLAEVYEKVTNIPAPKREVPFTLLYIIASANEIYARVTGNPVLLSMAAVNNIRAEAGRTMFDHSKSEAELGLTFRPIEDTIRDEVDWYRTHGRLSNEP